MRAESPAHRIALGLILVAGVGIRLHFLDQPLRNDEAYSFLRFGSLPWFLAISDYSLPNNHIFHTLLVHLSTLIAGVAPWTIRLPAFAAGVLLMPILYILARHVVGGGAALWTCALAAASGPLVLYATNARGYSLFVLFFLLALGVAAYALRNGNLAAWLALVVLLALGLHTLPVMLYPAGVTGSWMVLQAARPGSGIDRSRLARRLALALLGIAVLTLTLYLPVAVNSGWASVVSNRFVQPRPLPDLLAGARAGFGTAVTEWQVGMPLWMQLAVPPLFVAGVAASWRRAAARALLLASVAWPMALLLLHRAPPPPRAWLFLLPVALMMVAAGVDLLVRAAPRARLHRRDRACLLPVLLVLSLGVTILRGGALEKIEPGEVVSDAPRVAAFLARRMAAGDRVLAIQPLDAPLQYYLSFEEHARGSMGPPPAAGGRFFVVADRSHQQTPDAVLAAMGMPVPPTASLRAIALIGSVAVFELVSR